MRSALGSDEVMLLPSDVAVSHDEVLRQVSSRTLLAESTRRRGQGHLPCSHASMDFQMLNMNKSRITSDGSAPIADVLILIATAGMQRNQDAEKPRCRETKMQRNQDAEKPRCRETKMQRNQDAASLIDNHHRCQQGHQSISPLGRYHGPLVLLTCSRPKQLRYKLPCNVLFQPKIIAVVWQPRGPRQ